MTPPPPLPTPGILQPHSSPNLTYPSPGNSQGRGHGHPLADSSPMGTRGPARITARRPMVREEKYDHEDDYDSDDDVYASDEKLDGEEAVGISGIESSSRRAQTSRINIHGAEEMIEDRARGRQGGESYVLPFRGRESGQYPKLQEAQGVQGAQEAREVQEDQLSTPHYWQCHLCAHINPLFPLYPAMCTDPFTDNPQTQQQQPNHFQYTPSFASLPPSTTQPCCNRNVLPRAPSHALEYIEAPEKGSWEKRVRDAAAASALATTANPVSPAGTGSIPTALPVGNWPGAISMATTSGNVTTNPAVRMPGMGHGRGSTDRVLPPSPLRMTAFPSQSPVDDHCPSTDSTPLLVSSLGPATGTGSGTIPTLGSGAATAAQQAGINYASIPLSYAFSTADSSRSGPIGPARSGGMARGGGTVMRGAWPGLGGNGAMELRGGFGHGRGSSFGGGGAWVPVGPSPAETGGGLYSCPQPEVVLGGNTMTSDVAGSGSVFGAGIGGRCWHSRCEGCYDLDAAKRILGFCTGGKVDVKLYESWYASFGFTSGGGDVESVIAGGEGDGNDGDEHERDDENAGADEDEIDVMELSRVVPASRMQSRMRSPVRYSTGESRILLVQSAVDSDNDGEDGAGDDHSAKASSDDGEGVFGKVGNDSNDESESD